MKSDASSRSCLIVPANGAHSHEMMMSPYLVDGNLFSRSCWIFWISSISSIFKVFLSRTKFWCQHMPPNFCLNNFIPKLPVATVTHVTHPLWNLRTASDSRLEFSLYSQNCPYLLYSPCCFACRPPQSSWVPNPSEFGTPILAKHPSNLWDLGGVGSTW